MVGEARIVVGVLFLLGGLFSVSSPADWFDFGGGVVGVGLGIVPVIWGYSAREAATRSGSRLRAPFLMARSTPPCHRWARRLSVTVRLVEQEARGQQFTVRDVDRPFHLHPESRERALARPAEGNC